MKRFACAALLLFAFPAMAQAAHSVALSWTAGTPGALYKIYRAPCMQISGTQQPNGSTVGTCTTVGGPFAVIASTNTTSYTDTSVAGAMSYAYQITASCGVPGATCAASIQTGESVPSSNVGVVTVPDPLTPITPPSGLQITTVAVNRTGNKNTVVASWKGAPNAMTSYSFLSLANALKTGTSKNSTGIYSATWSGTPQNGNFAVCDYSGCASRLFAAQ